jgi:hypothetical protein
MEAMGPLLLIGTPVPFLWRMLGLVFLGDKSFQVGDFLLDLL